MPNVLVVSYIVVRKCNLNPFCFSIVLQIFVPLKFQYVINQQSKTHQNEDKKKLIGRDGLSWSYLLPVVKRKAFYDYNTIVI